MIALWAGASYLCQYVSTKSSLMAAIPATFMSAVSMTYILYAPEGFGFGEKGLTNVAYIVGICFAILCAAIFLVRVFLPASKKGSLQN